MKILVIEDNKENIERAKKQLAEHDLTIMENFTEFFNTFSVYSEGNFKDNKELMTKLSDYDCVLTDINLPSPQTEKVLLMEPLASQ